MSYSLAAACICFALCDAMSIFEPDLRPTRWGYVFRVLTFVQAAVEVWP